MSSRGDDPSVEEWDKDMTLMRRGIQLMFTNQLAEAEQVFQSGIHPRSKHARDTSAAFALQFALVSVIRGIASLADDSLSECLVRLQDADNLAAKMENWVGKNVIRGICTLEIGLIQCVKHSFVKGVWNILKSWKWIKTLRTDAMNFQGKEREVVRSVALMTCGIFELLLSLLPASAMRAASFVSGFKSDRQHGLDMLWQCFEEKGMLAPWGALTWVSYHVDTKTFLGETQTAEDFARCEQVFAYVQENFPDSVFFSGLEADLHACLRDIKRSVAITKSGEPFIKDLPGIEWALHYKLGVYALADLDFASAGDEFGKSLRVYVAVGRRSMVPFMAGYAFLCYQICLQLTEEEWQQSGSLLRSDGTTGRPSRAELEASSAAMEELLLKYKNMPKTDWGRQDTWAFDMYNMHVAAKETHEHAWPLLDLVDAMSFRMRCTYFMQSRELENLCNMVRAREGWDGDAAGAMPPDSTSEGNAKRHTPDNMARAHMCCAEIYLQRGFHKQVLDECSAGLGLESKLSKHGKAIGIAPVLLYLQARAYMGTNNLPGAKDNLAKIKKYGRNYRMYGPVMFKSNVLSQQLKLKYEQDFETLNIKGGASETRTYEIKNDGSDDDDVLVMIDWFVHKRTVSYKCSFQPAGGNDEVVINELVKYDSESGNVQEVLVFRKPAGTASRDRVASFDDEAEFGVQPTVVELPKQGGTLKLNFNNTFSLLRSKQVDLSVVVTP